MKRCGQLRHVFSSSDIPLHLKLNIYKSAVMSVLTYVWSFTKTAQARVNGANARCLSRLTGRSIHAESSPRSQTFDLCTAIRIRKWKWLDHILRTKGDRLIKLAVKVQFDKGDKFNMLQDVPAWCTTFAQLKLLAANRKVWRAHQPAPKKGHARTVKLESKYRSPPTLQPSLVFYC